MLEGQFVGHPTTHIMNTKRKILYVEDDFVNLELIRRMLKKLDIAMVETDNGHEVIEIVERERPDLIFMDMHLPEISGIDIVYMIKEHPEFSSIPIVALTADSMMYKACKVAGCEGFLPKPVSRGAIQRILEQFFGKLDH